MSGCPTVAPNAMVGPAVVLMVAPMAVSTLAPTIALMLLPDTMIDGGNAPRHRVQFVRK